MKVCLVAIAPYPGITFPELRNAASELARLGHHVTVVCKRQPGQPGQEQVSGVFIRRLSCDSRWATETFFLRAAKAAQKIQPDIIHVFWRFGAGIIPFMLGRRRCLLDIRTGSINNHIWRRFLENSWLRFDRTFFQHAVTLDKSLAAHLHINVTNYIPEGIPREMIKDTAKPNREVIRNKMGWAMNETIGIYVGTSYLRRLDLLFKGWLTDSNKNPLLRLVVVGDAMNNPTLRLLAEQSSGQIELRAGMAPEKVCELLVAADFGVAYVPNTPGFAYQQSTKILEYLVNNLPVLATATPANLFLIQDRINGRLMNDSSSYIASGINQFIHWLPMYHPDESARQIIIEKYSWPNIVKNQLLPMYSRII